MADSKFPLHPDPTPEDIAAAKAALQGARPDIVAESEEYNTRVQALANRRADLGGDKFDLMHCLREPSNQMERADLEALAGIITPEQRRTIYLANDPDAKVLRAFFDAWESRLVYYGAMLQSIISIATDQRRHPQSRRGEGKVEQHVAMMKKKSPLWSEEIGQVFRFLTQVRLDLDGKPVTLGKYSGESAHWLAVQVVRSATEMWRSCKRTAKRSRTRPEYLYATTATDLFYKTMIEKGDLPRPNDMAALMRLERAAAERALDMKNKVSATCANAASQGLDTATLNIMAQEKEMRPSIEKGIEFPGTEGFTFKSGMAYKMTNVFISYAHSSPEHKQTVSRLVEILRKKGLAVSVDTDVRTPQGPEEGWPKWMKRQIREANWVLMFFDKLYRRRFDGEEEPDTGLGATWEGAIITHHFYRDSTRNKKFIPLLADGASTDLIPDELVGYTRYFIPNQGLELAAALQSACPESMKVPLTPSQLNTKSKGEIMAGESPFPYEYGSDLHWLWGWGERLGSLLSDDLPPSKHDWMVFRPDRLARDAMMRFSIKYPHVIKQIDDYLDFTDARFDEFLSDDNDSTRADFASAMGSLYERIRVGVETIAQSEKTAG